MTTAPIAETRACCKDARYNYSQPDGLPDAFATIGYCHADAVRQNAAVARMLGADFPPKRVAIADTHSAVRASGRGCSSVCLGCSLMCPGV